MELGEALEILEEYKDEVCDLLACCLSMQAANDVYDALCEVISYRNEGMERID